MARAIALFGVVFVLFICLVCASVKKRYPDPKTKIPPKPKAQKLNIDLLPPLQEVLESLGLTRFLKDFVKMGVTETRLLVRLSAMDFQLMAMDWDGVTKEEITRLKDEVAALIIKASVSDEPPVRPEVIERSKLTYGRVYMQNSVQSYEYVQASFGGHPPIGTFKLEVPYAFHGCSTINDDGSPVNYHGSVVAVMRGNCTFLQKAHNARNGNASALIIVNSEDRLESPSSGLGVDKNITDGMVTTLNSFSILTFSNTSWAKLRRSVDVNRQAGASTYIDIVPLKCKSGGVCAPLLEEEKQIQDEVSWGTMRVRITGHGGAQVRSFDFMTSNFGAVLPTHAPLELVLAEPLNACTSLVGGAPVEVGADGVPVPVTEEAGQHSPYANKAVLVHRGGCRFDAKALNVQEAGAALVVIVDVDDNPLQRVGGQQPQAGYVGMPSVIITAAAGDHLRGQLSPSTAGTSAVTVEVLPARDSSGADAWIELAFTDWSKEKEQLVMQLDGLIQKYTTLQQKGAAWGGEIIAWLNRRLKATVEGNKKSIDTDA
jgi:hypothetical protein